MKRILLIGLILILLLLISCKTPQPPPAQPEQPQQPTGPAEQCANYTRNGILESHCATCGNSICEPFESCTASTCNVMTCTTDCGQLYCTKDCPTEEQEPPQLQPGTMPEMTATLRTCHFDSDCVRVNADCCGCAMGGKTGTLSKDSQPVWEKTLKQKCVDVACTAVLSNDWTCTADVKCVKNKCTLVKE